MCYWCVEGFRWIKIKNEKGKEVDYTGIKVSRDIIPENFFVLNSGEKIESDIKLSEVYELKKGKKYTIQFSTYHPSYLEPQELTKLESNVIEVNYEWVLKKWLYCRLVRKYPAIMCGVLLLYLAETTQVVK